MLVYKGCKKLRRNGLCADRIEESTPPGPVVFADTVCVRLLLALPGYCTQAGY